MINQSLSDILDYYEEYKNNIHLLLYFNILLCGRTGTGKSTFINKIMKKIIYIKIKISWDI